MLNIRRTSWPITVLQYKCEIYVWTWYRIAIFSRVNPNYLWTPCFPIGLLTNNYLWPPNQDPWHFTVPHRHAEGSKILSHQRHTLSEVTQGCVLPSRFISRAVNKCPLYLTPHFSHASAFWWWFLLLKTAPKSRAEVLSTLSAKGCEMPQGQNACVR